MDDKTREKLTMLVDKWRWSIQPADWMRVELQSILEAEPAAPSTSTAKVEEAVRAALDAELSIEGLNNKMLAKDLTRHILPLFTEIERTYVAEINEGERREMTYAAELAEAERVKIGIESITVEEAEQRLERMAETISHHQAELASLRETGEPIFVVLPKQVPRGKL